MRNNELAFDADQIRSPVGVGEFTEVQEGKRKVECFDILKNYSSSPNGL